MASKLQGFPLRMGNLPDFRLLVARNSNINCSEAEESRGQSSSSSTGSSQTLQNLAIRDLELLIQPGEKVAICGRSGRYIILSLVFLD